MERKRNALYTRGVVATIIRNPDKKMQKKTDTAPSSIVRRILCVFFPYPQINRMTSFVSNLTMS